jgi:hypothetical protein
MPIDKELLSPAQQIKLTFWHYIMRDPDLKNTKGLDGDALQIMSDGFERVVEETKLADLTPEHKEILDALKEVGTIR